jgi:hypothetical protein
MDFFAFIQPDPTVTNLDPHREEQTRACACGGGRDRWAHMWRWGKCVGEQGKEAVVVAFMICVDTDQLLLLREMAAHRHTHTHTHTNRPLSQRTNAPTSCCKWCVSNVQ